MFSRGVLIDQKLFYDLTFYSVVRGHESSLICHHCSFTSFNSCVRNDNDFIWPIMFTEGVGQESFANEGMVNTGKFLRGEIDHIGKEEARDWVVWAVQQCCEEYWAICLMRRDRPDTYRDFSRNDPGEIIALRRAVTEAVRGMWSFQEDHICANMLGDDVINDPYVRELLGLGPESGVQRDTAYRGIYLLNRMFSYEAEGASRTSEW